MSANYWLFQSNQLRLLAIYSLLFIDFSHDLPFCMNFCILFINYFSSKFGMLTLYVFKLFPNYSTQNLGIPKIKNPNSFTRYSLFCLSFFPILIWNILNHVLCNSTGGHQCLTYESWTIFYNFPAYIIILHLALNQRCILHESTSINPPNPWLRIV